MFLKIIILFLGLILPGLKTHTWTHTQNNLWTEHTICTTLQTHKPKVTPLDREPTCIMLSTTYCTLWDLYDGQRTKSQRIQAFQSKVLRRVVLPSTFSITLSTETWTHLPPYYATSWESATAIHPNPSVQPHSAPIHPHNPSRQLKNSGYWDWLQRWNELLETRGTVDFLPSCQIFTLQYQHLKKVYLCKNASK